MLQRGTVGIHLTPHLLDNHLKIELNLNGTVHQSRFANGGAIGAAISFRSHPVALLKRQPVRRLFRMGETMLRRPQSLWPAAIRWRCWNNITIPGTANNSIGNLHLDYELPMVPGLACHRQPGAMMCPPAMDDRRSADAAQDISEFTGVPGLNSKYTNE
jgi:hypothetical protein